MDTIQRAQQLLEQPGLARLIQIASLVKQALSADEVFVLKPLQRSGGAVTALWIDGASGDSAPLKSAEPQNRPILSEKQLHKLTSTQINEKYLAVHYFQDGYLWPQDAVECGEVQAIRLQFELADQTYLLFWVRDAGRYFTRADRECFDSLLESIAESDEKGQGFARPSVSSAGFSKHQKLSYPKPNELSPMEKKVLQLLKTGLTEKAVASKLDRSPNTIHVHVRNIYRKLFVNSRSELLNKVGRSE